MGANLSILVSAGAADVANNRTPLTVSVMITATGATFNTYKNAVSLQGSFSANGTAGFNQNTTTTLLTTRQYIYHNADGTASFSFVANYDTGLQLGTITASTSGVLPPISKTSTSTGSGTSTSNKPINDNIPISNSLPINNAVSMCIMKKENDTYSPYCPKNHALNVGRLTKNISYVDGEDLLTTLQNTANMFIAPAGEGFYSTSLTNINNASYMCGVDNFIAIFTPYNSDATHYMLMQVSYDGGKTWQAGSYYNSNIDTQINIILGMEATQTLYGNFEVLVVGQANASSNEANSYKVILSPSSSIPYSVNMFSGSKIPLIV